MSWKFVYNTHNYKGPPLRGMHELQAYVITTGYRFFLFNGKVYDINGVDTDITEKDLF